MQFFQKRYIRPQKAIWYIFEFFINKKFLFVEQLTIYLLKEQLVYFEEDVVAKKL